MKTPGRGSNTATRRGHQRPPGRGTIKVKSDGGKGRKRPYCVLEERVQKRESKKYRKLLEHLEHHDHVNSEPNSDDTSPKDTLKTEGCVEGQIQGSKTPQFDPKHSASVATREHHLSVKSEKRCSEKKVPDIAVINLEEEEERGHHPDLRDVVLDVTDDMQKEISKALGPGPQEEILSSAFKLHITPGDIQALKDSKWLNDEIINFYMNLLMKRNENQGYPALHAFNSFFYTKLKHGGHRSVRRWTQGVDLFAKELILVPIHLQVHWSLVAADLRINSVLYLDSMGQERQDICETIFQYLQVESKTQRNMELDPLEWSGCSMMAGEIPQQRNGSDCGMFTCKYADSISQGQPIAFAQKHMPLFRRKMVWEILHKRLL